MGGYRAAVAALAALSVAVGASAAVPAPQGEIVFSRLRTSVPEELYSVGAGGGPVRRLTRNAVADDDPAWSPEGNSIAFERDVGNRRQLFLMRSDGGVRRLVRSDLNDEDPAWSPDGRWIAFSRSNRGIGSIWVVSRDGQTRRRLTRKPGVLDQDPAWAPDSLRLVFSRGPRSGSVELRVVNVTSLSERRVGLRSESRGLPSWSPDGDLIAFTDRSGGDGELYTIRPNGTGLRRLTHNGLEDYEAAWSPDGRRLAFVRGAQAGPSHVWVMDTAGGGAEPITRGDVFDSSPAWRH